MDLLLNTARQRLNLPTAAWYIYRAVDGSVISNLDEIQVQHGSTSYVYMYIYDGIQFHHDAASWLS